MKIGEVFRYSRPYSAEKATIDGLPNFFAATASSGRSLATLEAGISWPAPVRLSKIRRTPAILIRSSPHKVGSETTPWEDVFRPDFGHIRYFGDNKTPGHRPDQASGNALLLSEFVRHQSSERNDRVIASPVICFRGVAVSGRQKGNVEFQGVGLIERAERVVQLEPRTKLPFANYSFDFLVIDLSEDSEVFDWRWITDRRDPSLTAEQALRYAPKSWRRWVEVGKTAFGSIRRNVSKQSLVARSAQQPMKGSREAKILAEIYSFYDGKDSRKVRFEALASIIAERVLGGRGGAYRQGWITQASGDNGIDFVARLDVGSDLARTKLVVLGQAKCEDPTKPTNGKDIARTVARLRRGWLGVYVTTSFFSGTTQQEVLEDQYPIVMIDGLRLAKEVGAMLVEQRLSSTDELLKQVDARYEQMLARRSPEEVMLL